MVNLGTNFTSLPPVDGSPLDDIPCGVLSLTDEGTIAYANATLLALVGWEADDLRGRSVTTILPVASRIFYQTHLFPLLRLQGSVAEVYLSLRSRSGQDIPILLNGVRRQGSGESLNDCVVIPIRQRIQYEDEILRAKKMAEAAMTAQKQAEATLQQQYERALVLGQITQQIRRSLHLPNIFAVAAQEIRHCLGADRVGILQFDGRWGQPDVGSRFVSEAVAPGGLPVITSPERHQSFGDYYRELRAGGGTLAVRDVQEMDLLPRQQQLFADFQVRASLVVPIYSGTDLWGLICLHQCNAPRYWQGGEVDLVEGIAAQLEVAIQQANLFHQLNRELQERQRAEAQLTQINIDLRRVTGQLERLAHTDPLTQIANRRAFADRLSADWDRLGRAGQPLSLLLFDVDYFKFYNDTYGHQAGDDCLVAIAQAAQAVVCRSADLLARYGGEEFAVVLPTIDRAEAVAVAERIQQAIADLSLPHRASQVSDQITLSLGLSTLIPGPGLTSTLLIQQADRALYDAKRGGRKRTVVFGMIASP